MNSSILERRREQVFPVFTANQIALARRFGGKPRTYSPRQLLFELGEPGTPAYLVLTGSVEVSEANGIGVQPVTVHGPGELTGEIGQLAGGPSLVRGRAGTHGAEVIPFDAPQLRSLVVTCAEVGEAVMRALILRRAFLIETGAGLVLLGSAASPDGLRLQNFLRRNAIPHTVLDPDTDRHAADLVDRLSISKAELPIVVCPDGTVLRNPTERAIAQSLGLLPSFIADRSYDAAIVGAGPAGLAAAVYAASEGLSIIVLDARAFGGQAAASARIENYLGFPTGISGEALAGRAYAQAQKFGAIMAIPAQVTLLKHLADRQSGEPHFELTLDRGDPVRASAVVIASGARYRKLDIPNLSDFEGRGVYYWASPIESKLCARRDVVVVGGGNSAGQATVFLAGHVSEVHLLVRARSLAEGMSWYLVDRINALSNVQVHTETELSRFIGTREEGLQAVRWKNRRNGNEEEHRIRHVFLFIGALPNTEWLRPCPVVVDSRGFVRTGERLSLETSQPGVFAIGDVRAGSVKRVSAAVGEGASLVAELHTCLRAKPAEDVR